MNLASYFGIEEKPTATSLKWWIEHPAKPLPVAGNPKSAGPVFKTRRDYPKPPIEEALMWAKKFRADGKRPKSIPGLVAKKIHRSQKRARVYLANYLAEISAA